MDRIVVPVLTGAAADAMAPLVKRPDLEVVGVAVDVGQGQPLDELHAAALAAGVRRCHAFDLRATLAERFLWPALRSGALAVPGEPIEVALSAPCVAQTLVDVARLEHATAICAFAEQTPERQRLHASVRTLAPELGIVALPASSDAVQARNLWAVVQRAEETGRPGIRPLNVPSAAMVTVHIDRGTPTALSGVSTSPSEMIDSLATLAREHAIGTTVARDAAHSWLVDAPAADMLSRACLALMARHLDERTRVVFEQVSGEYAALVRDGRWSTPLRRALDAFVTEVLSEVTGDVRVTLSLGEIEVDA